MIKCFLFSEFLPSLLHMGNGRGVGEWLGGGGRSRGNIHRIFTGLPCGQTSHKMGSVFVVVLFSPSENGEIAKSS